MKAFIIVLFSICSVAVATAQPPARLKEKAKDSVTDTKKTKTDATATASLRDFPVQSSTPENAIWRRDLYRTLDLSIEENAPLYYPTEPQGDKMNLFTYIFKLILRGQLKAYDYGLDGRENFDEKMVVKPLDIMDRYHINYEKNEGRVKINDSDIPSSEVLKFYVKESAFFDQSTATFHKSIEALCPVLVRTDEFGGAPINYPMFWIRYQDLSPFLTKLELMTSSINNAATMSAENYFSLNKYKGTIYKTNNLQGKVLANYCKTDTAMRKEQNKIEDELKHFEASVWGNLTNDSTVSDSLVNNKETITKTSKSISSKNSRRSSAKTTSTKSKEKTVNKKESKPKRSSNTTYSVRRQRH